MTNSSVGMTMATTAGAGAIAWLQAAPAMSPLERLAEITPLVALLLVGLWLLFGAYRSLVDRLVQVVEGNTRATTENTSLMREIRDGLAHHDDRLDRLESGHYRDHRDHQGGGA